MGKSIPGALQMSDQKILRDLRSVTSSPESVDGVERSSSPGGVQIDLFGLEARPASHSHLLERKAEGATTETYGPSGSISLKSINLQQSLESKLAHQLDTDGSIERKSIWNRATTPSGRLYFRLRALEQHIDGKDFGSWPTPVTSDAKGSGIGKKELSSMAKEMLWATPTATDPNRGTRPPRAHDTGVPLSQQVSGLIPSQSDATTEKKGPSQLNPRFSLWLMGYPIEWAYCAERVTPSSRKRRQKS
jgi:hypothetical protein